MEKARSLKEAGIDVIDFGPGEPDLPIPEAAGRAAEAAVREGFTRYTPVAGIGPLREAIARRLGQKSGVSLDASNIIVTCGAKQAIYNLCQVLFQEGDGVLIPRPYWVTFPEAVRLSGAESRFVDTAMESGFIPSLDSLESAVNPGTRGMILNYPNNPTGAVLEQAALDEIAGMARKRNLFVLSDETYDAFDFGRDAGSPSFLASCGSGVEGMAVAGSFSKTYSMTGWRIGYAAGSRELIDRMSALQSHQTGNPSSLSQRAALAVLNQPDEGLEKRIDEYRNRRDLIAGGLDSLPGIRCPEPGGAFYVFPDVRELITSSGCRDSLHLAEKLLDERQIAVVPGSAFGYEGHLRFSYAVSTESIEKGLECLERFCRDNV